MTFLRLQLGFDSNHEPDAGHKLASEVLDLARDITRDVNDCKMTHVVKKTSKQPFTYSKLAGVLVTFKVLGEPNYPETTFEFSYADMTPEPYETLTDELAESRPDLVMLGKNHKQVREAQTETFAGMGFTRRPKSIRSIVATICVNLRMRKEKATMADEGNGQGEEEKKQ